MASFYFAFRKKNEMPNQLGLLTRIFDASRVSPVGESCVPEGKVGGVREAIPFFFSNCTKLTQWSSGAVISKTLWVTGKTEPS